MALGTGPRGTNGSFVGVVIPSETREEQDRGPGRSRQTELPVALAMEPHVTLR